MSKGNLEVISNHAVEIDSILQIQHEKQAMLEAIMAKMMQLPKLMMHLDTPSTIEARLEGDRTHQGPSSSPPGAVASRGAST